MDFSKHTKPSSNMLQSHGAPSDMTPTSASHIERLYKQYPLFISLYPNSLTLNTIKQTPIMSNTTDAQFKKTNQEVNRPAVTDHNINDQYMKTGPLNVSCPNDTMPPSVLTISIRTSSQLKAHHGLAQPKRSAGLQRQSSQIWICPLRVWDAPRNLKSKRRLWRSRKFE